MVCHHKRSLQHTKRLFCQHLPISFKTTWKTMPHTTLSQVPSLASCLSHLVTNSLSMHTHSLDSVHVLNESFHKPGATGSDSFQFLSFLWETNQTGLTFVATAIQRLQDQTMKFQCIWACPTPEILITFPSWSIVPLTMRLLTLSFLQEAMPFVPSILCGTFQVHCCEKRKGIHLHNFLFATHFIKTQKAFGVALQMAVFQANIPIVHVAICEQITS